MADRERVGFIGLGIMGTRMAGNVARAGFELVVFNRTRETADVFAAEHGAEVAGSPAELAASAQLVVSMVDDGAAVEEVLLGENGLSGGAERGALCVDMSTIGPTASKQIGARLAKAGVRFLEAPVSGSSPKAQDATLTIMAGGDADDFERARSVLESMGKLVLHVGPLGDAAMLKLINNTLAAVNAAGLAEGIDLAESAGLNAEAFDRVIGAGSGASAMLSLKADPMRRRDYETLFKLDHMIKDVRLFLEEADRAGIELPMATQARHLLQRAADLGHGQADFAAVREGVDVDVTSKNLAD